VNDTRPIAVIEDSDEDFAALTRACRSIEPAVDLIRFRTGEAFLDDVESHHKRDLALPWLVVLLDRSLPGRSGTAVLAALRANPAGRNLPVVVLSGSANQPEVNGADQHTLAQKDDDRRGADGYVVKPFDADEFERAITGVVDHWRAAVDIPTSAILRGGP
jgi:CheY-like chemotaxis protein